jgi:glycosyltransferase involved in cell wall biosynthesis
MLPATRPFFASVFNPLEYWLRVAQDVRRQEIDVVHICNYSQALPILGRLTSAKLVLHMHCEWLSQLDRRVIGRRLRHADLIVGCSEYITNKVRERFPQHASRCMTIYNGVDTGTGPRRPDPETVRLLHVGRVSPEKGLHVLVDALERVVPKHPELRLTILGEESPVPYEFAVKISRDEHVRALARFYGGSYLQELRTMMSPAVADRVAFVDRVAHGETRRYYEESDIFVFPSIFEAFPLPPLEAMAAGLPVIASRAGGVVESVVDGRTGMLVDRDDPVGLADAITCLVEDRELGRSFGEAGCARAAAMFSWPEITAAVEQAFGELVGEHEPSAASAGSPSPLPG